MTWDEVAALEPRLRALERECDAYRGRDRLGKWYGFRSSWASGVKPRLVRLVGWVRTPRPSNDAATEAALRSSAAYDAAYDHLLGRLERRRVAGSR